MSPVSTQIPLAEKLRPTSIDQYVGQSHIIGKEGVLRRALESGHIPSMILWGPPGTGKTTLANIVATILDRPFFALSAINSGVKDVREVISKAQDKSLFTSGNPILFIDEIHRFSKSQQDSLLGAVEKGLVTLIGATTENPSFEVISALLSRCQVYVLQSLELEELKELMSRGISLLQKEYDNPIKFHGEKALMRVSGGDGRKLLNNLELVVRTYADSDQPITDNHVVEVAQRSIPNYDKDGENHYDIVSAFIKSIRGSDPNAAVYWLARMITGGEDPLFIARRLVIAASEDIGNANPNALLIANECFQAVNVIGYPEARIILSQATVYLACSAKSNASYLAIDKAIELVKNTGGLSIPMQLRNSPTKLMKDLGYGEAYKYPHDHPNGFVAEEYLPKEVSGQRIYEPGNNAREAQFRQRLSEFWGKKYGY
ncbi:MAG: putative ATPase [Bacteroidia bacterium]|jgi:putative ATPase